MNRIIFKNQDNSVSVLIPAQEVLDTLGLQAIAEKDVPYDLPYWIVSTSDIPTDRTFRNAWEIDESFGEPDGFGGENNEFDSELLKKYYEVRDADKN